ncbi:hypothetical protein MACH10_31220 [Thalassospira tepidiphila]|nr:hypothetical protein MACH10_31220 [Thalassospira tepidiphila]
MMIVGVILSGSRTALIILLTGCLYLFLSRKINYRFVVAVAVLGALAFPVMIVLLKGGVLQLSFLPNWVLEQEALIATIRGPYLVDASHAALTHWLFGAGFGIGAEVAFGQKANEMAVHSVFLNAIIETGVLGLILLSAVWIMSIVVAGDNDHRRSQRDSVMGYLSAVLLSLFVAQSVDLSVTRFHYVHLMFFFILGLVASFKRTELEMRV